MNSGRRGKGFAGRAILTLALITGAILMAAFPLSHPASAATGPAQPYAITSFTQRDTNGDGKPDEAEVHCRCYSANDRVMVVDPSGDMKLARDFAQGTNMANDLWLFDIGNRGFYQLAVQFHHVGNQLSADIYQDENGDGRVAVAPKNGRLAVTEPGYPAIHVVAVDGYWQRDGRIAPDFDLTVDGKMMATFGGELYESRMKNDGKPDVTIQVRGPHGDDPRSYDWRTVRTPIPASSGVHRTSLNVRERGQEPAFAPVFPWYLLGASTVRASRQSRSTGTPASLPTSASSSPRAAAMRTGLRSRTSLVPHYSSCHG